MSRKHLVLAAFLVAAAARAAQPDAAALASRARAWRAAHEREIVADFTQLLSMPNLASDTANIERNAVAIAAMLERRGVTAHLIREPGVPPLVVGDLSVPGAKSTIAFYAHYDGQPFDPAQWTSPPWTPVVRDAAGVVVDVKSAAKLDPEWRIYARSAGDDKGAIMAMLAALDAMHAAKVTPAVNVKFVYEGEEEAGSPHLPALLDAHAAELRADVWFLCDGPVHQSRRPLLFFGARGVTELDLTVYGPIKGLHDGHYGNWAPNPIVDLTHLIDSMRDTEGRILIEDFYYDVAPLTESERKALAEIPDVDGALRREFAVGRTEGSGGPLNEQILKPALNLRGIAGGRVGAAASNTINTEASASIDFRLVPNETPAGVREKVERHIAGQGWFIVRETPDAATRAAHARVVRLSWGSGYPPARTPMDTPAARHALAVMTAALGEPPVRMPSLGGSIPMYLFARGGVPVIGLPIANHDDNQHAANENLRLHNLWTAIEIYTALYGGF
jgi:acetylornithine deacetylase/succinyl-diaminopimelate desuccinylase-like protein